jgi:hypothetical protein
LPILLSIAVLATCSVTVQAQDLAGVYRAQARIHAHKGDAVLKYKLTLANNGDATMDVFADDVPGFDSHDTRNFGMISKDLSADASLQFYGRWENRNGVADIKFDRVQMDSGARRVNTFLQLRSSRDRLIVSNCERSYFGEKFDAQFQKQLTSAERDADDGEGAMAGQRIDYTTGGRGKVEFSDGARLDATGLDLKANPDMKFSLTLKAGSGVTLSGRYRMERGNLILDIKTVRWQGKSEQAQGSGQIRMIGRQIDAVNFEASVRNDSQRVRGEFKPARG